jgi:DNA-binding LacI/PurR family transcriptional regulator
MVKIRDIAELAKVSPATVSRVLNGRGGVSLSKKKRVLAAIAETGYRPNEIARSLYKKSSRIIGYVIPSILNIFLSEIGRAIEEEAFDNGYKVILCNTDESPEKESAYIDMLVSMNADGIIIISNNDSLEAEVRECPIPVVVLDQKIDARHFAASVQADNFQGGYLAAEHLVRCGCRHIVHMRGPQKYISGVERFRGYLTACEKYRREPAYIDCGYDFESGLACSRELLKRFPEADGILASSDMTALSLYKVLCERGTRVPDEMMIVGYDNIRLSTLSTPELTTIAQPVEKIGRLAVKLLIGPARSRTNCQPVSILPVSLKIRQTTKIKP